MGIIEDLNEIDRILYEADREDAMGYIRPDDTVIKEHEQQDGYTSEIVKSTRLQPADVYNVLGALPLYVQRLMQDFPGELFLVGGFIVSVVIGETPKDIDLCCKQAAIPSVAEKLRRMYTVDKTTEKATTYAVHDAPNIQLLNRKFERPIDVLEFDYRHCQAAVWFGESTKLVDSFVAPGWQDVIRDRTLVYTGGDDPLHSIDRARKFLMRGWKMEPAELALVVTDVVQQVQDSDLSAEDIVRGCQEAKSGGTC